WNSTGWQLATISGPAVGGVVIAKFDPLGAYLITALCQIIGMALASTLNVPMHRPAHGGDGVTPAPAHPWYAGAKFIWQTKPILATITLDLFAVLLGGATALLPVFAHDILFVGPVGMGWLRTAPSVGALAMALTLAHSPPLRRPGVTLLLAVAGF